MHIHNQQQKAFYDTFYEEGRTHADKKVIEGIKDYFIHRFLDRAIAINNPRVLEIGCGDGLLTGYLLARDLHVCAVDLSPAAIERLNVTYRPYVESGQLETECDDIVTFLAERSEKFDLIIGSGIIHHIDKKEWPPLFSALYGGLNEGGMLACGPEPNANWPYSMVWPLAPWIYKTIYQIPYDWDVEKGTMNMKSKALLGHLRSAGFSRSDITPFHMIPHFSSPLLAQLDQKMIEFMSGRMAMYTIVEAQK